MQEYRLSDEEKLVLKKYGEDFQKWKETDSGKREIKSHLEHSKDLKSILSSENILNMTKLDLIQIYKKLWASNQWKNKDWSVNQLIEKNGFDNLKKELYQLLYGNESFVSRYDSFRERIEGLNIANMSEILNMIYPEKYCLWNHKTKTVLKFLNLKDNLPEKFFKYNPLTGKEYLECLDYFNEIKNEMSSFGINDFIDLDVFFWHIHEDVIPKNWKSETRSMYDDEDEPELKKEVMNLEQLILEYDKNREIFGKIKTTEKEAMDKRAKFISDFPIDKITDIKIDDYVIGKRLDDGEPNRNTFCYRLEFGLPGFGILGKGTALKFGIFYSHTDNKYIYKENQSTSVAEAYSKILTQINSLIDGGKQFTQYNDWEKLSDIFEKIDVINRPVKSKILSVYFPDSIVSINSHNGIKQILKKLFHIPDEEIQEEFMLNKKKLWELKQNHPIMKNWSNYDYSDFVWYAWKDYFDTEISFSSIDEDEYNKVKQLKTKFWVVRAGSDGGAEKRILENSIVTIDWDVGNLSRFNDKQSLKNEFVRLNPNLKKGSIDIMTSEIWNFVKEINKDDIVVLPQLAKGSNHKVAIGKVVGNYHYRKDLPGIENTIPVTWLHKDIPIDEFSEVTKKLFGWRLTVYRLKKPEVIQSIINVLKKYNILPKEIQNLELEVEKDTVLPLYDKGLKLTLESLSEFLFMSIDKLRTIENLLKEKKQIIFYGPPGTSKTFVAKKFAEYFANGKENVEIIQFHPSYSYEDFIEGIKPKLSAQGEATGFIKQSGIFKNLVDKCIKNPDKKFVLIIDEINRGNISKIFGELIYLLEYRNDKMHLTYSPNEEFFIPGNLYIIGTMNSADRSIAFVDYALRRRFYFVEFYPDSENEDILKKWFVKNNINENLQNNILELMRQINTEISGKLGRDYQIGYSYFMKELDYDKIKRIIDYAIIPMIEQYFFGKKENIDNIKNICNAFLIRIQNGYEEDISLSESLDSFS